MAHWEKAQLETLQVGHLVRDTNRDYIGGVTEVFDTRVNVAWLKWDPRIENPMLEFLFIGAVYPVEVLVRDVFPDEPDEPGESDTEFTDFVERLLSRTFGGRVFKIEELFEAMGRRFMN